MTFTSKTTLISYALLSAFTFASTAHAGNAFNKFPVNQTSTNTHGLQNTKQVKTYNTSKKTVSSNGRYKRVVEPLPGKASSNITYSSDIGSLIKKGFNKMADKTIGPKAMPVYIDSSAYTAR